VSRSGRFVAAWALAVCGLGGIPAAAQTGMEARSGPGDDGAPAVAPLGEAALRGRPDLITTPESPPTLLAPEIREIDLNTALRLAEAQNPQLLIARGRVLEAAALRQIAAAKFLPSLNGGVNYDLHTGNLQQSNGNILSVNRSALYVGAGANAVAAGSVAIPGAVLEGNVATATFGYLASRQFAAQREADAVAVRNQAFLQTTLGYSELLRAEGRRAIAIQVRDESRKVAELTASYSNAGQGTEADAHRALTEMQTREYDIQEAEEAVLVASARLCFVLNLDPSIRLKPTDAAVVPHPIVPDPTPVSELIALGLLQRPELRARRAAVGEALMLLYGARALPFSPTVLIRYSAGGFAGGSDLVRPVFGNMAGRQDFDPAGYWTLRNLGVGNIALINQAKAHLGVANYEEIMMLDQVRAEVAEAYAKTHARYARIATSERAVASGLHGFKEDLIRIENTVSPAIETVNSLQLLARSRLAYLDAIIDYDRSQFELYVALGQPPADALARPAPVEGIGPTVSSGATPIAGHEAASGAAPPVPSAPPAADAGR